MVLLVVVGEHIEDFFAGLWLEVTMVVEALSADATGEVQVLFQDGHTSGVDGTEVGIFEETCEVAFGSLLKGQEGRALEAELGVNTVTDGTDETLEGGLG